MATTTVTVRGQNINAATFTSDLKTIRTASDKLGRILEGAVKQAAMDNLDWINRLFTGKPLVNANGQLSILGKAAKAYVIWHAPCVKIEQDKSGQWAASFTKNKKMRGLFCTNVVEGEKILEAEGELFFTFDDWQAKDKAKKADTGPTAKKMKGAADRAAAQLEKALEEWADMQGDTADFDALRSAAAALEVAAAQLKAAARDRVQTRILGDAQGVDADAAARSVSVKPQASKRADTDREAASA